jgi:hypothetical protein
VKWQISNDALRKWAIEVVKKYDRDTLDAFIRSLTYAANTPTFKPGEP